MVSFMMMTGEDGMEWLPSSGYEYADAPDIEVYFEGNQQAEDYQCEVWLPVVSGCLTT